MEIKYKKNNACWECTSHGCDSNGYPVATIKRKWDRIYRHYYKTYKGIIPPEHVVRHSCDNRKCINPDHLSIGTHADNVSDRVLRNRSAKGINNGRSKLSIEQVIEIRNNTTSKKMHLASKFGVDPKTIRNIQQGITWKG